MKFVLAALLILVSVPAYAQAEFDPSLQMPAPEEKPQEEAPTVHPDEAPIPGMIRKPDPLHKPDRPNALDFVSLPAYNRMVRDAIQNRPKGFEFGTFRNYYAELPQYDPLGEATKNEMISLAFTIDNDPDPAKRKEAFGKYGDLISAHLANIDIVTQALILSQQDKMFGDPKFYEYMRNGLLRSIKNSGTGRSLVQAYDAVTLGEETALLKSLRVKLLKTEPAHEGSVYYNMHQVQSPSSVEPYWIFVDVSKPMEFLEWQRQNEANTFTMPAQ